jgi:hypothetical protein
VGRDTGRCRVGLLLPTLYYLIPSLQDRYRVAAGNGAGCSCLQRSGRPPSAARQRRLPYTYPTHPPWRTYPRAPTLYLPYTTTLEHLPYTAIHLPYTSTLFLFVLSHLNIKVETLIYYNKYHHF